MTISDEWWTAPAEADNGQLIMVTGRDNLDEVRASGKYVYRIEVSSKYDALPDGMPSREDAELMEQADEALKAAFRREKKIGVITGIYTGAGERNWVIYTSNLRVFSSVFNRALQELPALPIVVDAESDPDWEEYRQMRDNTYINPGE